MYKYCALDCEVLRSFLCHLCNVVKLNSQHNSITMENSTNKDENPNKHEGTTPTRQENMGHRNEAATTHAGDSSNRADHSNGKDANAGNRSHEQFKMTGNWEEQSKELKSKFSQLTDSDLKFEAGKENEMIKRMETRLGKNHDEVVEIIKKGQHKTV